ncbi:MAG: hypothetical protein IKO62_05955 [Bacteroidales bacterium]|nr:hypothetical protein [Bacteroidales bacterium]
MSGNLPSVRKPYGSSMESDFETIALAVMQGRSGDLNDDQRHKLDLTRDAYRIVCGYPNKSVAVKEMCALHPELSERTALTYVNQSIRIWNPGDRLERDFLNTVFLQALIKEIYSEDSDAATRAKNLATLQRYLSDMPQDPMDPTIMEKHTINIQLNINGSTITVPADQWAKIKENKLIAAALDQEITEAQAVEIMEG